MAHSRKSCDYARLCGQTGWAGHWWANTDKSWRQEFAALGRSSSCFLFICSEADWDPKVKWVELEMRFFTDAHSYILYNTQLWRISSRWWPKGGKKHCMIAHWLIRTVKLNFHVNFQIRAGVEWTRQQAVILLFLTAIFFYCCYDFLALDSESRSALAVTTANTCPNMSQISMKSRFHETWRVDTRLQTQTFRIHIHSSAQRMDESCQFKQSFPLLLHDNSAIPSRKHAHSFSHRVRWEDWCHSFL